MKNGNLKKIILKTVSWGLLFITLNTALDITLTLTHSKRYAKTHSITHDIDDDHIEARGGLINVAHAGFLDIPNSKQSILNACLENCIDIVECDVNAGLDEPIIIHNDNLFHYTSEDILIKDISLIELRKKELNHDKLHDALNVITSLQDDKLGYPTIERYYDRLNKTMDVTTLGPVLHYTIKYNQMMCLDLKVNDYQKLMDQLVHTFNTYPCEDSNILLMSDNISFLKDLKIKFKDRNFKYGLLVRNDKYLTDIFEMTTLYNTNSSEYKTLKKELLEYIGDETLDNKTEINDLIARLSYEDITVLRKRILLETFDFYSAKHEILNEEILSEWPEGLLLMTWTVNDYDTLMKFIDIKNSLENKLDLAIVSDFPDYMCEFEIEENRAEKELIKR